MVIGPITILNTGGRKQQGMNPELHLAMMVDGDG